MLVGKALGPYVIDREIGHGAMGTVYHGFERKTNKPVALKIVSAGRAVCGIRKVRVDGDVGF